jgi:GMP synthase (glutamine-hydrolysing)
MLLQVRPEDAASDNEYQSFLEFTGLPEDQLERAKVENGGFPDVRLSDYSGIFLGGGPYNFTDPDNKKSPGQIQFEAGLSRLLDKIVVNDFPFLAACGIGVLVNHEGGRVSRKYGEAVGAILIRLTTDGRADKLLQDLPDQFEAFGGHKEACEELPPEAVLLASSETCPVQMFRIKQNVYATQFHSELDNHGLSVRIGVYKHAGYFPPEQADELIVRTSQHKVVEPVRILKRFVDLYQKRA